MYGASSTNGSMVSSSKAPSSLNYDPSISAASADIVETMHAEIELLMLSGGYSRDVAVKMLLNKVAKEKAMQQNGTVRISWINFFIFTTTTLTAIFLHFTSYFLQEPHTMHRAASMSNMPSSRGVVAAVESDVGYGYSGVGSRGGPQQAQGPPLQHGVGIGAGLGIGSGVGHAGADHHQLAQQQQHQHTLHSSRSMYAMPTAHTAGVSSGASVNGGGSVSSGRSSRSRPDPTGIPSHPPVHPAAPQQHYSQPSPSHIHAHPEAAFPTQYPQHSHSHSAGGPSSSGHNSHRRPSGSNISVASGKGSVASGASGITRLDSRDSDYIPNVLAQQEAAYGVNMYDYLAPDDPEVARLMGQFGFNKVDAMIAVFQQFPPQAAARSSGSRDGSRGGHPSGGIATNRYPGSSSSHGGLDNRQAPTIRRTAETAPKKVRITCPFFFFPLISV